MPDYERIHILFQRIHHPQDGDNHGKDAFGVPQEAVLSAASYPAHTGFEFPDVRAICNSRMDLLPWFCRENPLGSAPSFSLLFRILDVSSNELPVYTNSFHPISFFNLAFSISSLATMSYKRSTSGRFLLRCSAANLFPGRGLGCNPASPSDMYSVVQRQIILCSAPYSFSDVRTDICSSRCFLTIYNFCSGVQICFFCPFRSFFTPYPNFSIKKR